MSFVLSFNLLAETTYSQGTRLHLEVETETIKSVLKQIETQSDFRFFYNSELAELDKEVTGSFNSGNIDEILQSILSGTSVGYRILDNNFVVLSLAEILQQVVITGAVTDEAGEPVPGANVRVEGTLTGVITDAAGKYTITVPDRNAVLVFSFVGYATSEQAVGDRTAVNVILAEDTHEIDEVVVVGYGVMRKSDVTGAVLSVSDQKLKDRPVTNVMDALQGKAAGVDITSSGRPGELGNIRIRGERSLITRETNPNANSPLYVVNGIPLFGRDNINMLNTEDIKSIDILKDASATAIYGSRGANGVVLITTYTGEEGRFSVNYNGNLTFSKLMDSSERLDAGEWVDLVRWSYYYANRTNYPMANEPTQANDATLFAADPVAMRNVLKGWDGGTWDPSKVTTTDWVKLATRMGVTHNHTVSVSGGSAKMTTYASFGYMDQKGTSLGQRYQRYTFNLNSTLKPTDWFELGGRFNSAWQVQDYGQDGSNVGTNSGTNSITASALRIFPHALPYDDITGEKVIWPGGVIRVRTIVDEEKYTQNERQIASVMANAYAQVKLPVNGLSFRSEFGPSLRFRRNGTMYLPQSAVRDGNTTNITTLNNQRDFVWTINNMLLYNRVFGNHSVNLTLLQTASKTQEVGDNINAEGTPDDKAKWYDFQNSMLGAGIIKGVGSSISEEQLASYMFRVNYALKDRYLLTASGRWDGSSVLAEGNKWAFFPSASLGWRMDQEDFLKPVTWINQLKLRLGYGVTGNAVIARYSTKGEVQMYQYPYGSTPRIYYYIQDQITSSTAAVYPNKNLTWEKTGQWNAGVDFSLLKSRVNGSLEVYRTLTTGLLLTSDIPNLTGYSRSLANVGKTMNNGVELSLNTMNVQAAFGLTWETNLSVAWQKNKILELQLGKVDDIANTRFIGKPIGVYYDYEWVGLWREEDAEEMKKFNDNGHAFTVGRVRVKDQNGDYKIDANNDRTIIGQTNPSWTVGMNNTFSYKGIELTVQMFGRLGYWTNGGQVSLAGYFLDRKVDYYTELNKSGKYPHPEYDGAGITKDVYNGATSYSKASFINVSNLSLAYRFPKKMIEGWGSMQNLRVYAQVTNLGDLYAACDFKNMNLNSALWSRNFVFGVSVGF
jgi:TonB-linked SusC/RagA family outer membrane protein